jgi:hypothetical protein
MHPITVRWVATADEIPRELWVASFPVPIEGEWWYRALDRSRLEQQFRFAYGIIERGSQALGIAPTFLMDVPIDLVAPPLVAAALRAGARLIPRLRYQRTLFVGSPCSDEGTVGVAPGEFVASVLEGLQAAVEERARALDASMIVWKDFADEVRAEYEPVLMARGLFRAVSFPGTRVRLSGPAFEDYVAALKPAKRHRLRRNLRRGGDAVPLVGTVIARPDAAVLAEIFALFWQTYEHGKTKFERLTPQFFAAIAEAAPARFVLLREPASGRLVAFMLVFLVGSRVINKFIGIDYTLGRDARLYFRLWEHAVRWALGAGATEIQSGQTGYGVKLDLGHELVPLTNYCRHRNPVLHRVFASVAARITWASLDDELTSSGL